MKAVVQRQYGTPDVLQCEDIDRPAIGDAEVLVAVHAASVNHWDWDLLRGLPYTNRVGALRRPRYPILGGDIAGRVAAVGSAVTQWSVGDEVFGDLSSCGWGGFAEFVRVPGHALAAKPARVTFVAAAAVPQAAGLALTGLRGPHRIGPGRQVLINGAGGGVGTFAIQIAKSFGADVTAVDSAAKLDMMGAIGADRVLDYRSEDYTTTGQRYDLILDVECHRPVREILPILTPDGIYVLAGGSTMYAAQAAAYTAWSRIAGGVQVAIAAHRANQHLDFLSRLLEQGRVVPVVDRVYPLEQVPQALHDMGAGNVQGKLVIQVRE